MAIKCKNCSKIVLDKKVRYCDLDCQKEFAKKSFNCSVHGQDGFYMMFSAGKYKVYCNECKKIRRRIAPEDYKKIKCRGCDNEFVPISGFHKYCSQDCQGKHLALIDRCEHGPSIIKGSDGHLRHRCKYCENERQNKRNKYSTDHSISCAQCGVMFCKAGTGENFDHNHGYLKYCSQECFKESRRIDEARRSKEYVRDMKDCYIKQRIRRGSKHISAKDIPQELVEITKVQLSLSRKIKELKEREVG